MTHYRSLYLLILALALTVVLAACGGVSPSPASTRVPAELTATRPPAATATPFPTETPRPSPTSPPTEAPTATSTATATPDPALGEVTLLGLAWYDDYDLLLSFQFPGPVQPEDYRVTLEGKEYACEVLAQYPSRLYCKGQGAKVLAVADVQVYPAGQSLPGFEQEVWVPYFTNNYGDIPK